MRRKFISLTLCVIMRTYNIVDGNMNQLYKIANKAHNHEPGANSATDLNEF